MFKWINDHLFEILVIISIIIIIVIALFRIKKKGTWSNDYYYEVPKNKLTRITKPSKRDSIGEVRTRNYLEKYFKRPFTKTRPDFLINHVTGSRYNLEFDCYNAELKLAVEYNGIQHYKYIPFFHKNKEAYYNQKYRDEIKRIRCKDLGIKLIEIPYTELNNLENFIYKQLKYLGY